MIKLKRVVLMMAALTAVVFLRIVTTLMDGG